MSKLKCWKQNKKTGYVKRWDNGTDVVVVNEVYRVKSRKPVKFEKTPSFEAMESKSIGGWHSIVLKEKKDDAVKSAMDFMKDHDTC